jgi:hypothetical protein
MKFCSKLECFLRKAFKHYTNIIALYENSSITDVKSFITLGPDRLAYKKLIRMNMPLDNEGKVHFTTTLFALIRSEMPSFSLCLCKLYNWRVGTVGATPFSIMTFSIMTFSIITLGIVTFGIMTFRIMTFSIMTLA